MAKKQDLPDYLKDLMDNIDWTRWMQVIIPVMQPIVIFGAWLGLSKIDSRADAVSKLIAIAEPIPTIDLNVPKPVVLASLYHSIEDALEVIESLVNVISGIPEDLKNLVKDLKDEIPSKDEILPEELSAYLQALKDCNQSAKDYLGTGYAYRIGGIGWIQSCMLQKGRSVTIDWIKEKLADL